MNTSRQGIWLATTLNFFCLVLLTLTAFAPASRAAIIISQTKETGADSTGIGGPVDYTVGVSWTQANLFTNVSISALLTTNNTSYQGTAFLMRKIGPGTTVADEVAHAQFSAPVAFSFANVTLFSGLILPAHEYFLVLWGPHSSDSTVAWRESYGGTTITAAPGVTGGDFELLRCCQTFTYPPEQNLTKFTDRALVFAVNGDPVRISEPDTLMLIAIGIVGMLGLARGRLSGSQENALRL